MRVERAHFSTILGLNLLGVVLTNIEFNIDYLLAYTSKIEHNEFKVAKTSMSAEF